MATFIIVHNSEWPDVSARIDDVREHGIGDPGPQLPQCRPEEGFPLRQTLGFDRHEDPRR